jgi:hypothetical protein
VAAVNALVQGPNPVPGAQVINKAQVGAGGIGNVLVGQTEDWWGIVKVQELIGDPTATMYWSGAADPNYELVGLVYGGVDTYVSTDPVTGEQTVSSAGVFFDVYMQPKGTLDETIGSAGRLALDKYVGVGYDGVGNPLANSLLLLSMESTDGKPFPLVAGMDIDGDGDQDGDFRSVYTPNPPPVGAGTGESSLFWDIVYEDICNGLATLEVVDNYFPLVDPRFGPSQYGDMHGGQDFDPAFFGPSDWIITSDDPTRGSMYVVPEPLTMLGVFLGLGSLGGYVRRRFS